MNKEDSIRITWENDIFTLNGGVEAKAGTPGVYWVDTGGWPAVPEKAEYDLQDGCMAPVRTDTSTGTEVVFGGGNLTAKVDASVTVRSFHALYPLPFSSLLTTLCCRHQTASVLNVTGLKAACAVPDAASDGVGITLLNAYAATDLSKCKTKTAVEVEIVDPAGTVRWSTSIDVTVVSRRSFFESSA